MGHRNASQAEAAAAAAWPLGAPLEAPQWHSSTPQLLVGLPSSHPHTLLVPLQFPISARQPCAPAWMAAAAAGARAALPPAKCLVG